MLDPYAAPRSNEAEARDEQRLGSSGFLQLYAFALIGSAVLVASFDALQISEDPTSRFEAMTFVVRQGILAEAPLATAAALVIALVLWAARQPRERLPRRRGSALLWALAAMLPGYFVAGAIAIPTKLVWLLGTRAHDLGISLAGAGLLTALDFWRGAGSTLFDGLLIIVLAQLGLVRLVSLRLATPLKLIVALAAVVGAHSVFVSLLG